VNGKAKSDADKTTGIQREPSFGLEGRAKATATDITPSRHDDWDERGIESSISN
jgi:hypothetical protein